MRIRKKLASVRGIIQACSLIELDESRRPYRVLAIESDESYGGTRNLQVKIKPERNDPEVYVKGRRVEILMSQTRKNSLEFGREIVARGKLRIYVE